MTARVADGCSVPTQFVNSCSYRDQLWMFIIRVSSDKGSKEKERQCG
jgi:hypothetical protein